MTSGLPIQFWPKTLPVVGERDAWGSSAAFMV
jgi:hypothetical protein